MQITTNPDGRVLEHEKEQVPLPDLPVDSTIHVYKTPVDSLWVGIQRPGDPRPVYSGVGGEKLGTLVLEAEENAVLAEAKKRALQKINDAYDTAVKVLVASYPDREVDTFTRQEQEAFAWVADNTASTPFIDGMLVTRSISKHELVDRILFKAQALADEMGKMTGKRQALEKQINALTTLEQLETIQW